MTATLQVVCPHCGVKNRLKSDRPASEGRCGRCATALFEGHPVALTSETFERHLLGNDIPVLVDFWAPWCGPCRAMAPAFEQAAATLEPEVRLAKVNTQDEETLAARFQVQSIPTLVLFKGGREVGRVSGAMDAGRLVAWTRQQLRPR